jgi:DMATS type aromatic prenyltransferase
MTEFEAVATELTLLDTADSIVSDSAIQYQPQVGFNAEELVPKPTYVEAGIEKLIALCHAVGLEHKTAEAIEIFRAMTTSWGERQIKENSSWQSNVSDDGAPFEFSIAFKDDKAELRILLEAQGANPNLQSNWEAGLQLNQYLAERYHVSLDRFDRIKDLFVPTNPDASFSIWHSVCFFADKQPDFKIYLNPQAHSQSRAAATCEESLVRLGFPRAWSNLAEIAAQRGPDKDEFIYVSLDLDSDANARIKVYLRHHHATVDDLEKALSLAQNYVPGDVTEFCQVMSGGQSLFSEKPVISCFSWVEEDKFTPSKAILHLPISNYAANDLAVRDNLDRYFKRHDLPVSIYHSVLQALTTRSLESGVGMHSYTSLRRDKDRPRVTIYLNPEVNGVRQSDLKTKHISTLKPQQSIESAAHSYRANSIGNHPFFQRLHREPANLTHLWLFFINCQEAIVADFTRRLALVVAHTDSEYIRCILAKQLNEELGNGVPEHIHRKVFDRLVCHIEPYKPQSLEDEMFTPGHKLSKILESIYSDPNSYIGVGAAILMEIRGKQRDEIVGIELSRTKIDSSVMSWFHWHEEQEVGHADEVMDLANTIDNSDGDRDAVLKGAQMTSDALWEFCNDMYRVCFM